jgi:hypothetical protein
MIGLSVMVLVHVQVVRANQVLAKDINNLPTYQVPSFTYDTLQDEQVAKRLLNTLQEEGIVSIKHIPMYKELRERYLSEAAACVLKAEASRNGDASRFLSTKSLQDGTRRLTISTNAGEKLEGSSAATSEICPEYRAVYEEFSKTVEHAVHSLGSSLDKTDFRAYDMSKKISSRKLVREAVRLDHFHAYEAPVRSSESNDGRELSVPLHEDHGLFIAMSAPKFFNVNEDSRALKEMSVGEADAGLIIQSGSGDIVRPVLKDDELTIMVGTGMRRWLKTSHAIPSVMHAVRLPEFGSTEGRVLRAWFGKMTLLPSYQRMLGSRMLFEEFTNTTARYMSNEKTSTRELMSIGCAPGRHLQASEGKCTFNDCTKKPGATPSDDCAIICNRSHGGDEAACAEHCSCTKSPNPAEICWMMCAKDLSKDQCDGEQECDGQKRVCKGGPPTNRPTPTPTPSSTPTPTPTPTPSSTSNSSNGPSPSPSTTPSSDSSPSTTPSSDSTPSSTPSSDSTSSTSPSSSEQGKEPIISPSSSVSPSPTESLISDSLTIGSGSSSAAADSTIEEGLINDNTDSSAGSKLAPSSSASCVAFSSLAATTVLAVVVQAFFQ